MQEIREDLDLRKRGEAIEYKLRAKAVRLMRDRHPNYPDGMDMGQGEVVYVHRLHSYDELANAIHGPGDGVTDDGKTAAENSLSNLLERKPESGIFSVAEDSRRKAKLLFGILKLTCIICIIDGKEHPAAATPDGSYMEFMDTRGDAGEAFYGDLTDEEYRDLCLHLAHRDLERSQRNLSALSKGNRKLRNEYRKEIKKMLRVIRRIGFIQNVADVRRAIQPDLTAI